MHLTLNRFNACFIAIAIAIPSAFVLSLSLAPAVTRAQAAPATQATPAAAPTRTSPATKHVRIDAEVQLGNKTIANTMLIAKLGEQSRVSLVPPQTAKDEPRVALAIDTARDAATLNVNARVTIEANDGSKKTRTEKLNGRLEMGKRTNFVSTRSASSKSSEPPVTLVLTASTPTPEQVKMLGGK
jgi:hypothetical protein